MTVDPKALARALVDEIATDELLLRRLAKEIGWQLGDRQIVRQLIRDVALRTAVELAMQKEYDVVCSFFSAAEAQGVRLILGANGQLLAKGKLSSDLRAVLAVYRPAIVARLERERLSQSRSGRVAT